MAAVVVTNWPRGQGQAALMDIFRGFDIHPNGLQLGMHGPEHLTDQAWVQMQTEAEAERAVALVGQQWQRVGSCSRFLRLQQASLEQMREALSLRYGGDGIVRVTGVSTQQLLQLFGHMQLRPGGVHLLPGEPSPPLPTGPTPGASAAMATPPGSPFVAAAELRRRNSGSHDSTSLLGAPAAAAAAAMAAARNSDHAFTAYVEFAYASEAITALSTPLPPAPPFPAAQPEVRLATRRELSAALAAASARPSLAPHTPASPAPLPPAAPAAVALAAEEAAATVAAAMGRSPSGQPPLSLHLGPAPGTVHGTSQDGHDGAGAQQVALPEAVAAALQALHQKGGGALPPQQAEAAAMLQSWLRSREAREVGVMKGGAGEGSYHSRLSSGGSGSDGSSTFTFPLLTRPSAATTRASPTTGLASSSVLSRGGSNYGGITSGVPPSLASLESTSSDEALAAALRSGSVAAAHLLAQHASVTASAPPDISSHRTSSLLARGSIFSAAGMPSANSSGGSLRSASVAGPPNQVAASSNNGECTVDPQHDSWASPGGESEGTHRSEGSKQRADADRSDDVPGKDTSPALVRPRPRRVMPPSSATERNQPPPLHLPAGESSDSPRLNRAISAKGSGSSGSGTPALSPASCAPGGRKRSGGLMLPPPPHQHREQQRDQQQQQQTQRLRLREQEREREREQQQMEQDQQRLRDAREQQFLPFASVRSDTVTSPTQLPPMHEQLLKKYSVDLGRVGTTLPAENGGDGEHTTHPPPSRQPAANALASAEHMAAEAAAAFADTPIDSERDACVARDANLAAAGVAGSPLEAPCGASKSPNDDTGMRVWAPPLAHLSAGSCPLLPDDLQRRLWETSDDGELRRHSLGDAAPPTGFRPLPGIMKHRPPPMGRASLPLQLAVRLHSLSGRRPPHGGGGHGGSPCAPVPTSARSGSPTAAAGTSADDTPDILKPSGKGGFRGSALLLEGMAALRDGALPSVPNLDASGPLRDGRAVWSPTARRLSPLRASSAPFMPWSAQYPGGSEGAPMLPDRRSSVTGQAPRPPSFLRSNSPAGLPPTAPSEAAAHDRKRLPALNGRLAALSMPIVMPPRRPGMGRFGPSSGEDTANGSPRNAPDATLEGNAPSEGFASAAKLRPTSKAAAECSGGIGSQHEDSTTPACEQEAGPALPNVGSPGLHSTWSTPPVSSTQNQAGHEVQARRAQSADTQGAPQPISSAGASKGKRSRQESPAAEPGSPGDAVSSKRAKA